MSYDLTYQRAEGPTDGPQPGTVALTEHILGHWDHTHSMGIYNPRKVRGSTNTWSVHAEGRAVDIGVNLDAKGLRTGDKVAAWLIHNAEAVGIQYFIWNRRSWRKSRGWRDYRGTSPHRDHLHVEMTREAAADVTLGYLRTLPKVGVVRRTLDRLRGTDTREGLIYPNEFSIDGAISSATGFIDDEPATVILTKHGEIFCFPPHKYAGAPNNETQGRKFDIIGELDSVFIDEDSGYSYVVSTDLDFAYGF